MSTSTIMSLYIPHVFANIDEKRIMNIFDTLSLCKVKKVDFVSKNGQKGIYNSVYLHIDNWYNNIVADNFQRNIRNPIKEARIVYDDPWYWVVLENTGRKFVSGQRKSRIDLSAMNQSDCYLANRVSNDDSLSDIDLSDVNSYRSIRRTISFDEADDFVVDIDDNHDSYDSDEKKMLEIERMMDEEDSHLITIDGRYVQEMEKMVRELQETLCKTNNEYIYWFTETGRLQHLNNLLMDEVSSLKAEVSVLTECGFENIV